MTPSDIVSVHYTRTCAELVYISHGGLPRPSSLGGRRRGRPIPREPACGSLRVARTNRASGAIGFRAAVERRLPPRRNRVVELQIASFPSVFIENSKYQSGGFRSAAPRPNSPHTFVDDGLNITCKQALLLGISAWRLKHSHRACHLPSPQRGTQLSRSVCPTQLVGCCPNTLRHSARPRSTCMPVSPAITLGIHAPDRSNGRNIIPSLR